MKLTSTFRFFTLASAILSSFNGFSQSTTLSDKQIDEISRSVRLMYIDGRPEDAEGRQADMDSITQIVKNFYYDQFRNSQDPYNPYFLFISKGSELSMGIGGGVRFRMYYDWDGAMPSTAFSPYTIQIPDNPASPRRFNTTPSGTYLNFQVIGHNKVVGSYGLYIEADFTGYEGRDFRLKKGYVNIHDFTLGYATSTFSDPAAQPAIADAAGPNNKFSNTNVLVRYMKAFKNRWYVAASVETPGAAIDQTTGLTKAVSNWLPDAAAFFQYQWTKGQHIRLSGIVRSLSYLTVADKIRHNKVGWGTQLSAVAKPESHLTTYATLNYGHGYAGLGGDLLYGSYDLVPVPSNGSEMYAPASFGWCLGLQYNFKPNLFATLAASQSRYLPKNGIDKNDYKYGLFGCANVFWSIVPRITVAAEYDLGKRMNFSGESGVSQRFNLSCMFTF